MSNTERDYYRRHTLLSLFAIALGVISIVFGYHIREIYDDFNIITTWVGGLVFVIFGIIGIIILILEKTHKLEE